MEFRQLFRFRPGIFCAKVDTKGYGVVIILRREWIAGKENLAKLFGLSQECGDLLVIGRKLHLPHFFFAQIGEALVFEDLSDLIKSNFFFEVRRKYHSFFLVKIVLFFFSASPQ